MGDVSTVQNAVQNIVSAILSEIMPEGANVATPFITNLIMKFTGLGANADSPMWTDMTPYGAGRKQLDAFAMDIGQNIASKSVAGERDAIYAGFQSMLMSEASYGKKHNLSGQKLKDQYQQYVNKQVEGMKASPFWSYLYNATDPADEATTATYMTHAAANLIRSGFDVGDYTAPVKAQELISNVFKDDSGKEYQFDKRKFGGMSQPEVAALTAALTRDADLTDLTRGADINDSKKLQDAANKFKERVGQYANALAPLKDIFGKDIPEMIKSIEELSGQTLAQMTPQRAEQLARDVVYRTQTGAYSMDDVYSVKQTVAGAYTNMNMSSVSKLMATNVGLSILDATNGGIRPSTMTSNDWANEVADMRIRESASQNTQHIAKAYAMWKQRKGNENATFADFENAALDNGYDTNATGALLTLAGVTNTAALNTGMNYRAYTEALQNGDAAKLNTRAASMARETSARLALRGMQDLRKELGRDTDSVIDKAITAARVDARLLDPFATEAREEFFKENKISNRDADGMIMIWNRLSQDDTFKRFRVDLTSRYNQRKQDAAASRAAGISALAKEINIASGPTELIAEAIKNGFNSDWIDQKMATDKQLAVTMADKRFLLGTRAVGEELKGLQQTFDSAALVDYGMSAQGLLNKGFMQEVENYMNAGKGNSKAVQTKRREAAIMANLYRTLGNDIVHDFIGDEKDAPARRALLIKAAQNDENKLAAYNVVQNAAIVRQVEKAGKPAQEAFEEILKSVNLKREDLARDDQERLPALRTALDKWGKEHKTEGGTVDALTTAFNKAVGQTDSAPKSLESVLLQLVNVMTKVDTTLTGMKTDKSNSVTTAPGKG